MSTYPTEDVVDPINPPQDPVDPETQDTEGEASEQQAPEIPAEIQARLAKIDALEKEIGRLRPLEQRIVELDRSAQYWHEQATKGQQQTSPPEPTKPTIDPDAFVRAVTTGDADAIVSNLTALGFIRNDQAKQLVDQYQQSVDQRLNLYVESRRLEQQFPDLQRPDSELFQETTKVFDELVGVAQWNDPKKLMETAATIAHTRLTAQGKLGNGNGAPSNPNPAPQQQDNSAFERARRTAAIAQQRGAVTPRKVVDNGPQPLTEEQRREMNRMNVSEEWYRKSLENIRLAREQEHTLL